MPQDLEDFNPYRIAAKFTGKTPEEIAQAAADTTTEEAHAELRRRRSGHPIQSLSSRTHGSHPAGQTL